MIEKLVSGGQTGVDRAALDVALELALPCGGWCPRGRRAEDGPLPARYPLEETCSAAYAPRTRRNVREADATLVLCRGPVRGGTALTIEAARRRGKPCHVVDLAEEPDSARVRAWLHANGIRVLNVAGPRESENPGISELARSFLRELLAESLDRT
jgi:hypothetical protein